MTLRLRIVAALAVSAPIFAQPTASLLLRFDNEHDLAQKEKLLGAVTNHGVEVASALLRVAQSTANIDTRWMAMRGLVTLHYTASASFLEASLQDPNAFVRANAARALGDFRIRDATSSLLDMFAGEQEPPAIQQASLALRMLNVKAAAPYIREKIPAFSGQTRSWLIQALGILGSAADVPMIAGYLDDMHTSLAATEAIQELAGVNFGPRKMGLSGYPPPETRVAQAWWNSHRDKWPQCDDCRPK